jgi:hypothetical protein
MLYGSTFPGNFLYSNTFVKPELMVKDGLDLIVSSLYLSSVLIKRSQLIEDNESLELQNNELRILLAQYMQSPVNQELEIPPTKILQIEYSQ